MLLSAKCIFVFILSGEQCSTRCSSRNSSLNVLQHREHKEFYEYKRNGIILRRCFSELKIFIKCYRARLRVLSNNSYKFFPACMRERIRSILLGYMCYIYDTLQLAVCI
ncbi:hypothetical protein PUN28_011555 [Cardiocondyla obscurior]|uniref:Secreted protein n=1 Tax=Cardiocondyla obscurior TaxID=286306 RepID=A0AAW2FEH3_9HYME